LCVHTILTGLANLTNECRGLLLVTSYMCPLRTRWQSLNDSGLPTRAGAARSGRVQFKSALDKIPAKKWGHTEIAERGRSVLVMRARYRSAGLIPHQRGWTDAG